MILASLDGGYIDNCTSIFEYMKDHCTLNIGTINAILKAYSCSDMFAKAKKLFESVKEMVSVSNGSAEVGSLEPDAFTYTSMLVSCASACQWECFEFVYKEMTLSGYKLELSRHSWLLVEASKSGKWHILEHAFDTTLESGEIPHSSLFMEMLCQAIIQQDFRRSTPLLNAMALACMEVSERQWTKSLKKKIRIASVSRNCRIY
ncbi:hypothetical protein HPP92_027948 [Vanilla planifolia]|uniref:Pentatricopeptide repeat-containing protein n=1 Tax=Vanilla planifolia TaxID=51239 RepID=A0A835P961_VANPL|nr:hypothetical protein HPP92_027948 [Vanilla planifolia]